MTRWVRKKIDGDRMNCIRNWSLNGIIRTTAPLPCSFDVMNFLRVADRGPDRV